MILDLQLDEPLGHDIAILQTGQSLDAVTTILPNMTNLLDESCCLTKIAQFFNILLADYGACPMPGAAPQRRGV